MLNLICNSTNYCAPGFDIKKLSVCDHIVIENRKKMKDGY